ncbi:unnamed protein product [Musa acuminata subsp. burmannicoides]
MASPAELSLDYKPNSYTMIQKQIGEQPDQTQKIQDFLARLEEERHKIDAFKRELPLCMQLLNNAIECYKQQLETYQTNQGLRPVLEEFIPLKHLNIDGSDKDPSAHSEKASWMVSAQLWCPPVDAAKQQPVPPPKETEQAFDVSPKLSLDTKQRNGGAFLPFSKEKSKAARSASRALPELALASPEKVVVEDKKCVELENGGVITRRENGTGGGGAEHGKGGSSSATEGQAAAPPTHRKARRCWSPDLHRRFVNALQILGGSQVATPKQIRELMKVDGLTNDEVKSHLQKYRLHTRRPAPAPQAAAAAAPQLVVLGGIWVPPEYATSAAAAAAAGPAIYGAHAAPAHYCAATPVPQEFYPPPPPVAHHHHLHPPLHRGVAAYKGRSSGSPESEVRSGGERSESIEEEEEGEEREEDEEEEEEEEGTPSTEEKALLPLPVKAEDGNGGGNVALKF